ncbi:hypothetical protein HPP92_023387 [Vanilla planifolia]|uniref:WW domain-containing protein n=1 Tax=Vanilla planifolia TaxID=51239 RepID=A0A835PZB8_VANPL|nr:hypothetical protein HPP92_023387 [Vanilla planifolia]
MDHPELSLSPLISSFQGANNPYTDSEAKNAQKRKLSSWEQPSTQINIVDLQVTNPLPIDWEQCLDLHSGRMYYLNRRSLKKTWVKPKKQRLDLDLNIANFPVSDGKKSGFLTQEEKKMQSSCGSGGMVAIVCLNCHLLVLLYLSSPSCPNCKYMHTLLPSPPQQKMEAIKSPETLSLLH